MHRLHVSGERVIVSGRDGVELVIMATGARDGEAEKALPENFKLIRDPIGLILSDIGRC